MDIPRELSYIGKITEIALLTLSEADVVTYYTSRNITLNMQNFVNEIEALSQNSDSLQSLLNTLLRMNLYEVFEISSVLGSELTNYTQNLRNMNTVYNCVLGNYYSKNLENKFIFINGVKFDLVETKNRKGESNGIQILKTIYESVFFRTQQTLLRMMRVLNINTPFDKTISYVLGHHPNYSLREITKLYTSQNYGVYKSEMDPIFSFNVLFQAEQQKQQQQVATSQPTVATQPIISRNTFGTNTKHQLFPVTRPHLTLSNYEQEMNEKIAQHPNLDQEIQDLEQFIQHEENEERKREEILYTQWKQEHPGKIFKPEPIAANWADEGEELIMNKIELNHLKYLRNYRDRNLQQGGKKTNITNKYIHKIEKYTQKINELKKY